jgi:hypothetical protein
VAEQLRSTENARERNRNGYPTQNNGRVCRADGGNWGSGRVNAQGSSPDSATAAAIAKWRSTALTLVPAAFQDVVAESYLGQVTSTDAGWVSQAIIVRQNAEQAALAMLDKESVSLIESYCDWVAADQSDRASAD